MTTVTAYDNIVAILDENDVPIACAISFPNKVENTSHTIKVCIFASNDHDRYPVGISWFPLEKVQFRSTAINVTILAEGKTFDVTGWRLRLRNLILKLLY